MIHVHVQTRLYRIPGLCESERFKHSGIPTYLPALSTTSVRSVSGSTCIIGMPESGYGDGSFPFSLAQMQITTIFFAETEEVLSGFHQALSLSLSLSLQPPPSLRFQGRPPHAHAQSLTSLLRTRSPNLNHLNLDLSPSFHNLVL